MAQSTLVKSPPKIVLPVTRSEVDKRWTSQKFLMIGQAGIGKSEFWSHGDKTLYIQTEAGLNHLSVMKLPCRSWAEYKDIETALIQSDQKGELPYDTVIVDTIDRFIDFANEEIVDKGQRKFKSAEISVIGDIPNGAGWSWSTDLVMNAIYKLEQLKMAVVLIGHLDRKEIKLANSASIHLQTISIGGKTGREIVSWADHFMNLEASMVGSDIKRRVRTMPSNTVEAKSKGGMVQDGWVWDSDSKKNYDRLRSMFV